MVAILIALLVIAAFDLVVLISSGGVDSRPGFSDGRTDVKDNWMWQRYRRDR